MIKQTTRIYKVGERPYPLDKVVLIYWLNGNIGVAPSAVLSLPHPEMTHWAEVPLLETPFQRAHRENIETEIVTDKQWDDCAKRVEKKNLRQHGRSLSWTGISRRAQAFIVEIRLDKNDMVVKKGWREAMQTEV